ncbi:MAG: lytic transglycosylase domain-containing protein [Magnetococcales bacterium]|nr:lytic transglycosylase domain-containing protein [Magnetococcales bacterium]
MNNFARFWRWVSCLLILQISIPTTAMAEKERTWQRHEIKAMVAREARRMGLPISLALAVAHVESYFNPEARSNVGAIGVMQIMPATGRAEYGLQPRDLRNPLINIRVGVHFLKRLIETYDGRVDIALSHYNGGSSVVTSRGNLRVIPATRSYVDMVQGLKRRYDDHLRKHGVKEEVLMASR